MDKREIAQILEEIGTFLELKGENPFKVRAYYTASRSINSLEEDIETLVKENRLREIKGIGESIAEKISILVTTGRLPYYEELKSSFPPGLQEMLTIPGLGPKRVKTLYEKLNISTVHDLEKAALENKLIKLDGFGKKIQENIIKGIAFIKEHKERYLLSEALEEAETIYNILKTHKSIIRLSIAGSLRRRKEVIKDIDFVASVKESGPVMNTFVSLPQVLSITAKGDTKSSVILKSGIAADIRTVSDKEFPYALHHFTGSKEHNIAMRQRAESKFNIKMNEYGLFKKDKFILCKDEEEIFKTLKLSFIPPELREDLGEIEMAEKNQIPPLILEEDIKGEFHVHTTWSDGRNSILEIVNTAISMGYEYIGIADHSQSAYYANGLTEERIKKQKEEIYKINKKFKNIKIFHGIEVDIKPDGTLDYPQRVLEEMDFVIAAVHSSFTMPKEEMTKRIIKAITNPYVSILAHPTGRLLLLRDGYALDMEAILECAAKHNVIIELNSQPQRLDIDWRYLQKAKQLNIKIAINTDAHGVEELHYIKYGVGVARKGWMTKNDVINAYKLNEVIKLFSRRN